MGKELYFHLDYIKKTVTSLCLLIFIKRKHPLGHSIKPFQFHYPASIYLIQEFGSLLSNPCLIKISNRNTRTICEICSKDFEGSGILLADLKHAVVKHELNSFAINLFLKNISFIYIGFVRQTKSFFFSFGYKLFIKGATKSYFAYYSFVAIVLFNTRLCMSVFYTIWKTSFSSFYAFCDFCFELNVLN